MSLDVQIENMRYEPRRPELRSAWVRRVLGLPELGSPVCVIKDFSLSVREAEVLAVVGVSGAGKTTLLRIMAGLETGYEGSVSFSGESIRRPDRRIYLMPQAHTLLPWLTVERNLLFNVRDGNGVRKVDHARKVDRMLETFKMEDKRRSYPQSLSGGERARVALMCAMCANPEVLLLDEPFRGLDQFTKEKCIDDLLEWLAATKEKETVILVSHDISDAVLLADRVIVVRCSPLGVHKEFARVAPMKRRSAEAVDREEQVLDALTDVAAQQGSEPNAASPQR